MSPESTKRSLKRRGVMELTVRIRNLMSNVMKQKPKLAIGAAGSVLAVAVISMAFLLSPSTSEAQGRVMSNENARQISAQALPRFVSLKADKVNVRRGPGKDHDVVWVFNKAGLPVEVVAEFETWRRIRDSEGAEGWVFQGLLSSRRTALVKPWARDEMIAMRSNDNEAANVVAWLQPNVVLDIEECDGQWCLAHVNEATGYVMQNELWGIYPNEVAEF